MQKLLFQDLLKITPECGLRGVPGERDTGATNGSELPHIATLLSNRAIEEVKTRYPGFYRNKSVIPKKTGDQISSGSEEAQLKFRGNMVQDGISEYHIPDNKQQGLHDFVSSPGCIHEIFDLREATRTEEPRAILFKVLKINSANFLCSDSEPTVLETPTGAMECTVIPAGNSRDRNLYRCSDTDWGIIVDSSSYSWLWNPSQVSTHINSKELLIVLYALQLRNFVVRYVLIYSDNTTTSTYLRKFGVTTSPKLIEISPELPNIQIVHMEQPLLLPTVESNPTSKTEGGKRALNTDSSNSAVEDSHLVPRLTETVG
ncbi:hypothetical protein AYI68_g7462 [Smittium mucronatum]|uniref:Uncharacterized protein n=1 Tax=Smittium mucronatum TaxID=133383 RepID=A0A1R0GNP3_9FUNG|nr:hypothetical protein AYI68_g7462 [Smittium mucronatum]